MFQQDLLYYVCLIPVILLSLAFHEFSHAFVSDKLGDHTARDMGRLTLNPIKHLDPLGTLMIIVSSVKGWGFGWAKPVPISPRYYKRPKLGTVIVSLAGPLSNLLLAFIFAFPYLYLLAEQIISLDFTLTKFENSLLMLSKIGFQINLGLSVFNLIPIPPLDGSKILSAVLPARYYFKIMQYENYIGLIFLAIVLLAPQVLWAVLGPVLNFLSNLIQTIVLPIVT